MVTEAGVKPLHAVFERSAAGFRIVPQQAAISVANRGSQAWRPQSRPQPVRAGAEVWLTPDVRLPWPCPEAATAVLVVGRATDCDIVIEHPAVSGRHALLIVGPGGTVVLADQNSRNGLFLQPQRQSRIQATLLGLGTTVYFGTHGVASSELCRAAVRPQAPASVAEISQDAKIERTGPTPAVTLRTVAMTAAAAIGVIGLCGGVAATLFFGAPDRTPATPDRGALAVPPPNPPPTLARTLPPHDSPPPTVGGDDQAVALDVGRSVYWVTLQHDGTGARFRLGSGVAVRPDTIVTTASILRSAQSMQQHGYSDLRVLSINGQQDGKVLEQRIWSVFKDRSTKAEQLSNSYQQLVAAEADPAAIEHARRTMNLAFASASAADLAMIRCEPLPGHVPLAEATEYWPRRSVRIAPTNLDSEDPRVPPINSLASLPSAVGFRVEKTAAAIDGVQGAVLVTGSFAGTENWLGVPVLVNQQLSGLVTYQNPATDSNGIGSASIVSLEFVSATTIRAALDD